MNSSQNTCSSPGSSYSGHGQHSESTERGRDGSAEFYKRKISALEDTLNQLEEDRRVKKRLVSMFQGGKRFSLQLTFYNNSKSGSQTQPGRGIRKVVDLFHDLIDLLGKADKHAAETALDPAELEEINDIDFLGLTEEEIDDERKE